jgi:iron complex outermembrane receptor protein
MKELSGPRGSRHVALAVALVLGSGAASNVLAQAPASEDDSNILGEVIVTAQFRAQNVQDTPLAITAVSAELLEARNQTNITEITSQAPNVTLKQQGATFGPSIAASIRGIGQVDFNPAVEPGVGIYVDDVYYATLTGGMLDLLDLERVEILRGPQGTLAGRNSIGGAVKLYSQKPQGDGSGYLAATYGSRDRVDLRGTGDFAITDTLSARVSGVSKRQRGYVERRDFGCEFPTSGVPALRSPTAGCVVDYDSDVNLSALRGALRWEASDDLEFNLAVDYTHDDRNPTGTVMVAASSTVNQNVQPVQGPGGTALSLANFIVPPGSYHNYASYYSGRATYNGSAVTDYPMSESRTDPNQFFDGWGVSLGADWSLTDALTLQSISAYREYDSGFSNDNDLSPLANSLGYGTLPFHSFSQELRLNGGVGDRIEYTLGAFYMDQRSRYESYQDLRYTGNNPLQFQQNDVVNADTQAVFAHVAFEFTDALTLTGGVRYTEEHKDYTFVRLTREGAVHPFLGILNGLKSNYDGDNVDYRIAVQYDWADDLMTYLQFATGFKGGGVSPRPFIPGQAVAFAPETLDNYELGIKTDLFDGTMRVNASVFYGEYDDIQLGLQTCPQFGGAPNGPCGVFANAGDAEIKGAELETVFYPLDGLAIDASVSYIDFQYQAINPAVGGPARPGGIQLNFRPPYMPEQKWSLGAQYDLKLGNGSTLTPRVDVSYQGDLYTNGNNRPSNYIGSYTLSNARLTWRSSQETWEAALEATNLGDKYYFVSRTDQLTAAGHTDGQPGRPREYAVTVKRKF